jgi:CRISPR-associated protein Csx3
MSNVEFKITKKENLTVLEFELPSGTIVPEDLKEIDIDPVKEHIAGSLVIISGRGPIWLYTTLSHLLHPCKGVAIFDPRIGGGIVTQSHSPEFTVGDIIPL